MNDRGVCRTAPATPGLYVQTALAIPPRAVSPDDNIYQFRTELSVALLSHFGVYLKSHVKVGKSSLITCSYIMC